MPEKEYISREAAIEAMYKDAEAHPEHTFWVTQHEALRSIPAAEVRPVVLCRDCTFFKPQQKSARWSSAAPMCSRSATIKMPPDGFCSFGVKREES